MALVVVLHALGTRRLDNTTPTRFLARKLYHLGSTKKYAASDAGVGSTHPSYKDPGERSACLDQRLVRLNPSCSLHSNSHPNHNASYLRRSKTVTN